MLRPKTRHLKTFAEAATAVDDLLASQAMGMFSMRRAERY